ncbi:hypothetical protein PENTCL1PPCAC_211 [Pristionchus entomophagus]|uniref:Uncharacterized protein n=1 Tax=Pristionchus entomophagus TaxID=358040 RepID=A0AAV5SEC1_9BILA|nr:hypothetical protein PENTCL1PPCAC_211 [Pristionchus entomophagus]
MGGGGEGDGHHFIQCHSARHRRHPPQILDQSQSAHIRQCRLLLLRLHCLQDLLHIFLLPLSIICFRLYRSLSMYTKLSLPSRSVTLAARFPESRHSTDRAPTRLRIVRVECADGTLFWHREERRMVRANERSKADGGWDESFSA